MTGFWVVWAGVWYLEGLPINIPWFVGPMVGIYIILLLVRFFAIGPSPVQDHHLSQLEAEGAISELLRDGRMPVVYLRPFACELARFSGEQSIAADAEAIGPFIAVGRPDEDLPLLGAKRFYIHESHWRRVITLLIKESRLIIVRAGASPGLMWELEQVNMLGATGKVIIHFEKSDRRNNVRFVEVLERAILIKIPAAAVDGGFVHIGAGLTTRFTKRLCETRRPATTFVGK